MTTAVGAGCHINIIIDNTSLSNNQPQQVVAYHGDMTTAVGEGCHINIIIDLGHIVKIYFFFKCSAAILIIIFSC